jgi:DNA-directed RNA polymerase specialized sigma24 family protein
MTAAEALLIVLPGVRGLARRFARNGHHEADELAQVIALRFLECWPKFRGEPTPARIGGWCKAVARGAVLHEWEWRTTYRRNLVRLWSGETSCKAHRDGRPRSRPAPRPTPSLF